MSDRLARVSDRLRRVVERLDIRPGDRVLEIGCGHLENLELGERRFDPPT